MRTVNKPQRLHVFSDPCPDRTCAHQHSGWLLESDPQRPPLECKTDKCPCRLKIDYDPSSLTKDGKRWRVKLNGWIVDAQGHLVEYGPTKYPWRREWRYQDR